MLNLTKELIPPHPYRIPARIQFICGTYRWRNSRLRVRLTLVLYGPLTNRQMTLESRSSIILITQFQMVFIHGLDCPDLDTNPIIIVDWSAIFFIISWFCWCKWRLYFLCLERTTNDNKFSTELIHKGSTHTHAHTPVPSVYCPTTAAHSHLRYPGNFLFLKLHGRKCKKFMRGKFFIGLYLRRMIPFKDDDNLKIQTVQKPNYTT